MKIHFSQIDWRALFNEKSSSNAYSIFLDEYRKACFKYIPQRSGTFRTKSRPLWMTKELASLSTRKRNLWHSNQRTGWRCISLIDEYKTTRNKLKKEIKTTILNYEREFASDKKNQKLKESVRNYSR